MCGSDRKLTVGVIGAGAIVENVHLPVLLNTGGVSLGWILDPDNFRAGQVARAYGTRAVSMPTDLTDLPTADIFLLAAPYGARKPYFEALKHRSAAIYVEKPFARSLDEHDSICSLFTSSKVADGYQRRSWGPTFHVRELVQSKVFGRLKTIRFEVGGPQTTGSRYAGNPLLGGGGILMEVGCHGIDLALFVLNAEGLSLLEGAMITEDGLDLHTRGLFEVNCAELGPILLQIVASSLKFTANSFILEFENASVAFSIFAWEGFAVTSSNGARFTLHTTREPLPLTGLQTFHSHWSHFIRAVKTGEQNHSNAGRSRLTAKALQQLYQLGR
jgi:predicted dehydrogenase